MSDTDQIDLLMLAAVQMQVYSVLSVELVELVSKIAKHRLLLRLHLSFCSSWSFLNDLHRLTPMLGQSAQL